MGDDKVYYHSESNFLELAKGLGWEKKEINRVKKMMKEQGRKISIVEFAQKCPQRVKFIKDFREKESFRKSVDMGWFFGKKGDAEIEDYIAKYKDRVKAPGKNIQLKDMKHLVTVSLYEIGNYASEKNTKKIKVKMQDGSIGDFENKDGKIPGFCAWDQSHDDPEHIAEDVTTIAAFGEAALLKCMRRRLVEMQNIYTYVADIVLVLNPYMGLPPMCIHPNYPNQLDFKAGEKPSNWAIAHFAYWGQMNPQNEPQAQSCIVSGESGAGKTVACGIIMKYLAKLSDWAKMKNGTWVEPVKGADTKGDITALVAGVSPFLECFGNAKTNMNDNSSRFGKFTKIHFHDGSIVGAELVHYLLEKARICSQGFNERNYHIFYFLLRGGMDPVDGFPDDMKNLFSNGKTEPLEYPKLREGEFGKEYKMKPYPESGGPNPTFVREGESEAPYDIGRMNRPLAPDPDDTGVRAALTNAGILDKAQYDIWKVVAGVLRMTNAKFKAKTDEQGEVIDKEEFGKIAELLGFPTDGKDSFESLVCCQIIDVIDDKTGEKVRKSQTDKQCQDNLNALLKGIYGETFAWLINDVCNDVLEPKGEKESYVGLLDIFGFENFIPTGGKNSIEQLCINFANEKLQFLFNRHVFDDEKKMYMAEGLQTDQLPTPETNEPCINLVSKKNTKHPEEAGFLRHISAFKNSKQGKIGNNNAMVDKWNKIWGLKIGKPAKGTKKAWMKDSGKFYGGNMKRSDLLTVLHYAGDIEYNVENWLQKNEDSLPMQLSQLVKASTFKFLADRFQKKKKEKKGCDDLCGKYLEQLDKLSAELQRTGPHYVRCVKPNDYHMTPLDGRAAFDAWKTYRQLLYAGVMNVVDIKKKGYPFRETYEKFWKLRCVPNQYHKFLGIPADMDPTEATMVVAEKVLKKPTTSKDSSGKEITKFYWVKGTTKLFGKEITPNTLSDWHKKQVAGLVQGWWRYWAVMERHALFMKSVITMQIDWKQELLRRKMEKLMPHVKFSQNVAYAAIARPQLLELRKKRAAIMLRKAQLEAATITVEKWYRGKNVIRAASKYTAGQRTAKWYRAAHFLNRLHKLNFIIRCQKWYRAAHLLGMLRKRHFVVHTQKWYRAAHLLNALNLRHYVVSAQHWARKYSMVQEWNRVTAGLRSLKAIKSLASVQKHCKVQMAKLKAVRSIKLLVLRWNSATKIQQQFRRLCAANEMVELKKTIAKTRSNLLVMRGESLFQMWLVKFKRTKQKARKQRGSKLICDQYKIWRVRILWRTYRLCAIEIERHVRGVLARMAAHRRRYVLVRAQAVARTMCWMGKYLKRHRGIVKIQSQIRMFLLQRWIKHFKQAANTIRYYYVENSLRPRRLKSWWDEASKAALNGNLPELASLIELFDAKYSNVLSLYSNLVNMKEKVTKRSLVHLAVRSGSYDCVRFLLHRGAWPDEVDLSGLAPIHVSCGEGDVNQPITALLLEPWEMKGPSIYSYDSHSPRIFTVVSSTTGAEPHDIIAWMNYVNMRRQYRHNFRHPRDLLELRDAEDMTPLDNAVNSPNEHEATVRFLVSLGAAVDPVVMEEQQRHRSEQLRRLAYHRLRAGEEKLAQAAKEMADPIAQLMAVQTRHAVDPLIRKINDEKRRRAAKHVQRTWRGHMVRQYARALGHRLLKRRREVDAQRRRSQMDMDTKEAKAEGRRTQEVGGRNLQAQSNMFLNRLKMQNMRVSQGFPPIPPQNDDDAPPERGDAPIDTGSPVSLPPPRSPPRSIARIDAPPEADPRLMDLLSKARASVYLDNLKDIAGLMVADDLLTLDDAEFDEVAYMIGMKPFDKKRLKQQIDLANGKLPSPVQSLPEVPDDDDDAAASRVPAPPGSPQPPAPPMASPGAGSPPALPGHRMEEKGIDIDDVGHGIAASSDIDSEMDPRDMAAHEAKRFAQDIDEIMRQAMEGAQQAPAEDDHWPSVSDAVPAALDSTKPSTSTYGGLPVPNFRALHRQLSKAQQVLDIESRTAQNRSWYYTDPSNTVQGPFTREAMRSWYTQGHLSPELPTRFGSTSTGPFEMIKNQAYPQADTFADLTPTVDTLSDTRDALAAYCKKSDAAATSDEKYY